MFPNLFRQKKTIYRRTFFSLMAAILVIFAVLALVFWLLFVENSKEQLRQSMTRSAGALAERVEARLNESHERVLDPSAKGDLVFAARAGGGLAWLINSKGEVILTTAMAEESKAKLTVAGRDFPVLPEPIRNQPLGRNKIVIRENDYEGILPQPANWISVSAALSSPFGSYGGEIILHRRFDLEIMSYFMGGNALIIAFVIAFLVAMLIFFYLSHNITRPVRKMITTADAVYRGDLSARVDLDKKGSWEAEGSLDEQKDDLLRLVQTFNLLIEKWEDQEESRQEFMSSISHDLRSPLTSMNGYITAMLDGTIEPADYDEYLSIVKQETLRMQNLVQALFEVSLAENKERYEMSVFDMKRVLEGQLKAFRGQLVEKGISLELELEDMDGGQMLVFGDELMLGRVVQNLLNNALRYTPEGGEILIRSNESKDGEHYLLAVEDNGPGIKEEHQKQVFERFFKEDKSRGTKGQGLGLYIARSIMHRHGESIICTRSERLGGACFELTLEKGRGQEHE